MARYQDEDILGLCFRDGRVACRECCTEKEWEDITEDEILIENEEEIRFCDRCKRKF